MNAEGSDVCASLATDPKNTEILFLVVLNKFALVNISNSELSLDGSNSIFAISQSPSSTISDITLVVFGKQGR